MTWYRNLKLSFKLTLTLGLVLVAVFAGLITLNLRQLHTVSLERGELDAHHAGMEFASTFSNDLNEVVALLDSFAVTLLDAKEKKTSRTDMVQFLAKQLENQKGVMGLYTLWEPNAYDGNDKANVKKTAYDDDTGRFIPYVAIVGGKQSMEPLKSYDKEGEGDYYQLPKKSKKLTVLEPYAYEVQGQKVLMTSIVLPIIGKQGEFLGIVGADIALDQLQKNAEKEKPLNGHVTIVSSKGVYIANGSDAKTVSKPYADNPEKQQVWQNVQNNVLKSYSHNSENKRVIRDFTPVEFKGSEQTWYVETVVPESTVLQVYEQNKLLSLGIALGALLLLGVLMALVIQRVVVANINRMVDLVKVLAEGDFTQTLTVNSKDEFGRMGEQMNVMIGKLRSLILHVTDLSMSVGATSQELTASAEQTSRAAETIAQSIQEVAAGAETQDHHASESSRAMSEMAAGIQRVATSSAAVSESAKDVTEQTAKGNQSIQEAVRQMGLVRSAVGHSEEALGRLSKRSETIGGIVGLITSISMQTNILALNAAIEASRVGEQGKGFAVVAGEVRKLAEQTKEAASEIAALIEEVRQDTSQAMEAMGVSSAEVGKGVETVEYSGALFQSILDEMTGVNQQLLEVSAAAEEMSAGAEQVSDTMGRMAEISREASDNSQSVASASEEQLAAMEEISSSSAALSSMVQELLDKMAQFKV